MESRIFRGELDDEQRAVFAHILNGKKGRDIAASLGTTQPRVEAIVRKTCRQLDASSRNEAARIIANHYGWKQIPAITLAYSSSSGANGHYGAKIGHLAATMAQTEREHQSCSGYVRDVGNQAPDKGKDPGAYNEVAGRFSFSKIMAASSTMQRLLLTALLIASCALALGTLVSAMQGFDTLFFS